MQIELARVYEKRLPSGFFAILADRLWPRGLKRDEVPFQVWLKDVAPSPELRRWYGHDVARWRRFAVLYRGELQHSEAALFLGALAEKYPIVLLSASADLQHSHLPVLREFLEGRGRQNRREAH